MRDLYMIILVFCTSFCYSQASWGGKFYFNLIDSNGEYIQPNDLTKDRVEFCSFNAKNETIKYDSINNSFVYDSHFITTVREFYVIAKEDTMKVQFPVIKGKSLFINKPIQIREMMVSYYSPLVIDFMVDNESSNCIQNEQIFYLRNPTEVNPLTDKDRKHIKEHSNNFFIVSYKE